MFELPARPVARCVRIFGHFRGRLEPERANQGEAAHVRATRFYQPSIQGPPNAEGRCSNRRGARILQDLRACLAAGAPANCEAASGPRTFIFHFATSRAKGVFSSAILSRSASQLSNDGDFAAKSACKCSSRSETSASGISQARLDHVSAAAKSLLCKASSARARSANRPNSSSVTRDSRKRTSSCLVALGAASAAQAP